MAKKNNSDFIDLRAILSEYISKWYWFLISVVLCVGLGYVATKILKPKYAINANVLVTRDEKGGMASLGSIGELFGSNASVDDEIFVISSHSLYRDVIRDLATNKTHTVKLGFLEKQFAYPTFPVDIIPAPGILDTLRTGILFRVNVNEKGLASVKVKAKRDIVADVKNQTLPLSLQTPYGHFVVDTTSAFALGKELKTDIFIQGYDAAAEDLDKDVEISIANKRSNAIALSMKTVNTDYGRDVLNEIITKYNERGIAQKNLEGEKTARFIDERLAIISSDLSQAENQIQNYKENKGITDVGAEAAYQTGIRGETEKQLVSLQTQAELVKMTSDFISDPANKHSYIPITAQEGGALAEGIRTYNQLLLDRMSLAVNAKPGNKTLQMLDNRIDTVRSTLATSVAKTYQNLTIQLRELKSQYNKAMGSLGTVPEREREFLTMRRQQEVKQALYLFLLQRREETAMMLANATPKGIIVDEAYALSKQVNLSKKMILLLAFIIGLCIPPALLYFRKMVRTKFDTKEEVESQVDVPILGEICNDKSSRSVVVQKGDHSSTTELFNLLRSRLLFVLGSDRKVVMLTSTTSGEGKTFVSINLAADMSLLDKRVLLIGMDVRKPRLAEYLGVTSRFGLTQYLASSDISIDQMIVHSPQAPNLDIITSGPVPPNPAELLSSQRLDDLMAQLRSRYDYIIIDSAPIGMVSDTFTLARFVDATVYVVRASYTKRSDLRFIDSIYEEKRLKNLTLVVNGTATNRGYGYGYGYGERKHN